MCWCRPQIRRAQCPRPECKPPTVAEHTAPPAWAQQPEPVKAEEVRDVRKS